MLQICHDDKEKVLAAIRSGHIDAADLSFPCLIDTIVLTMKRHGLLAGLSYTLDDKRRDNLHIPFDILLALAVTAKLKLKTSLTDVPFAVSDAELLAELGWNLWDNQLLNTAAKNGFPFITTMCRIFCSTSWACSHAAISWTAPRSP